jgi:two-component system, OmpR family, sensor histidine kinase KdpD
VPPVIPRPDPERLLKQVEAEERYQKRGLLKIFLGYASGVGKSYRMLDEGRRRKERGQDVVVGALQSTVTPEVECVLQHLEVVPVIVTDDIPSMNIPALLRRHPQVCLVDGLAYDNPPGSVHTKRWQDVDQLIEAGISVITTVNLQYIEERQDEVERITGKRAAFSVPMSFVNTADEIAVVDAPTETCLQRDESSALSAAPAFKEHQLSRLRELSLVLAAEVVDHQLENYLERNGIEQIWGTQERILVILTPGANAESLIASGKRNADRFHGELYVVHSPRTASKVESSLLESALEEARSAGAHIEELPTDDTLEFILQFAHSHGITQIFIGQSGKLGWRDRFYRSLVDRLIQSVEGIDIQVFPK